MKSSPQKLCELVGKKYILFTNRGNTAIKMILEVLKMSNKYDKVLIQDQGGWLTYPQFIDKLKFQKIELKTDYGLINISDLKDYKKSILLINSMPGYYALEDMEGIDEECKKYAIFLINDASGSIGTDEAKCGDIVFGSFGEDKPLELGEGGFIATDDEHLYKELCLLNIYVPSDEFLDSLDEKIDSLHDRLTLFDVAREQVLQDLMLFNIIHPKSRGINVIVKFNNENEKIEILEYCKEQNLETTICPRYIRVNVPAVSIEIKRLKEDYNLSLDAEEDEVE